MENFIMKMQIEMFGENFKYLQFLVRKENCFHYKLVLFRNSPFSSVILKSTENILLLK